MPPHGAELMDRALRARQAGDIRTAIGLLEQCVTIAPDQPAALNMLGLALVAAGRPAEGCAPLRRAAALDSGAPTLPFNLADALQAAGDRPGALVALDQALARDPYFLPALLRKGQFLEASGDPEKALRAYRALLTTLPSDDALPPVYASGLVHARALLSPDGETRRARLAGRLTDAGLPAPSSRAQAYIEQMCGLRRVFAPQPTGPYFPFLPAYEYFDEALFPWFADLEAAYPVIREEIIGLWREEAAGFGPYVRFDATTPANQWSELNHSLRWSAFFLWKDGQRQEENIARCPGTARAMESLPLLDVPGKSPTVMFSILAPGTRIPAHTGVTNTRATIHLPLVVPGSCRFRVGGETREWVEGKAWAFDDTIEHEAWNDSDKPRAILIIDGWNPFLTDEEKAVVRLAANEMRLA